MLASRTITWRGAAVTVVRRDDLGERGFDLVVAAEQRRRDRAGGQRCGRRRCGFFSRRGPTDRAWPAGLREGHDRGHDSARSGHRGPRDQPDEGVLRRPGDHHPRAASRPRTGGATAGGPDVGVGGSGASQGLRSGAAIERSASVTSAALSPALRAADRLGLRPQGFCRAVGPLSPSRSDVQVLPAVVTKLPFVRGSRAAAKSKSSRGEQVDEFGVGGWERRATRALPARPSAFPDPVRPAVRPRAHIGRNAVRRCAPDTREQPGGSPRRPRMSVSSSSAISRSRHAVSDSSSSHLPPGNSQKPCEVRAAAVAGSPGIGRCAR